MVYVTTNGFRPLQKCLGFSGLHILYDLNKAGTSEGSCSEIPAYVTAVYQPDLQADRLTIWKQFHDLCSQHISK